VVEVNFGHSMRSWFFNVGFDKIPKVYEALKTFIDYCYKPENQLVFKLENGSFKKI
jgi:hypothetical protein